MKQNIVLHIKKTLFFEKFEHITKLLLHDIMSKYIAIIIVVVKQMVYFILVCNCLDNLPNYI